jgi:hypothetical protein
MFRFDRCEKKAGKKRLHSGIEMWRASLTLPEQATAGIKQKNKK